MVRKFSKKVGGLSSFVLFD